MLVKTTTIETPAGRFVLAAKDGALCAACFAGHWRSHRRDLEKRLGELTFEDDPGLFGIADAFRRYLAGELDALDAVKTDTGGTPFQRKVWAALRTISAGRTASYRDVAKKIGRPTAVRAVGAANGRNPVAVVIPCHRVIASNGTLGGYGGGLEKKRWLLRHEGALLV